MWCIVVFHSHGGFQLVGPFESEDEAKRFNRKYLTGEVYQMISPQEVKEFMEKNR